jgi:hypothetical protein
LHASTSLETILSRYPNVQVNGQELERLYSLSNKGAENVRGLTTLIKTLETLNKVEEITLEEQQKFLRLAGYGALCTDSPSTQPDIMQFFRDYPYHDPDDKPSYTIAANKFAIALLKAMEIAGFEHDDKDTLHRRPDFTGVGKDANATDFANKCELIFGVNVEAVRNLGGTHEADIPSWPTFQAIYFTLKNHNKRNARSAEGGNPDDLEKALTELCIAARYPLHLTYPPAEIGGSYIPTTPKRRVNPDDVAALRRKAASVEINDQNGRNVGVIRNSWPLQCIDDEDPLDFIVKKVEGASQGKRPRENLEKGWKGVFKEALSDKLQGAEDVFKELKPSDVMGALLEVFWQDEAGTIMTRLGFEVRIKSRTPAGPGVH